MTNRPRNEDLEKRRIAATPRGAPTITTVFADRAKNAELWDVEGRRYIDFAGGIGVLNTGHLNPRVTAAVATQLQKFSHTCYTVVPYESYVDVAEKLNAIAPITGPVKSVFFTTGVEAVENAIKIARAATRRSAVIAFSGAFHGRTMMGMALTGKVAPYKSGFGPFPSEIYHVPFPSHGVSSDEAMSGIEQLFKADIEPERVAAIIIEPVQGEGGFNVTPPSFLAELRALCDAHGIVFIADEIQSGFGRTGRWFSIEHSGVEPDLIATAKSLAGGYPLSAVIGKAELMDRPKPGGLGGTYAGSPIGLAAAGAVIDVMKDENLLERATTLGGRLTSRLKAIQPGVPQMAEIRGIGSMIAAEFRHHNGGPTAFDPAFAKRVQQHAMSRGLILLTCGNGASAIRFLYPLTIEDTVFDEATEIVVESILSAGGRQSPAHA